MTYEEKQGTLEIIKKFIHDMHELTGIYPYEIKLRSTAYDILAYEVSRMFEKNSKTDVDLNCFTLFGTNIKKVGEWL